MRRFLLGAGLLALLLALGLWISFSMNRLHRTISQTLTEAAQLTLSGELDAGHDLAQGAQQVWDSHWHSTASVADHAPMDEIDGLFAQLETYAQAGQTAAFAANCTRLATLIEAVGEAHSLTWWNLL